MGGPDESEPSGKASQRRRHLSGHLCDEEDLGEREGRSVPGRGNMCKG